MSSLGMGILKKGLEMGIAEGFEIGLAEGLAEGFAEGLPEGFEIGLADVIEIDKIIEMYKAKAIELYKAKAIETGLAHAMYDLVNAGLITPTTGAEMTNKLLAEFETGRAEYNRQKSLPSIPTG